MAGGVKKFNNRLLGHEKGINNIQKILEYCVIKKFLITIYALKDNLKKETNMRLKIFLSY